MRDFKFTEHFSFFEMTKTNSGLDNTPEFWQVVNLYHLCCALERLRNFWNKPLVINSAFRSEEVNAAVGGVKSSFHCKGLAADIRLSGKDIGKMATLCRRLGIFYEIIEEPTWLHVSLKKCVEFV